MKDQGQLANGRWQLARHGGEQPYPLSAIRYPLRSSQSGVALITAILIVALATILAVDVGFKGYLDQRRTATTFAMDQSYEVALGAEAWAADILRTDKAESPKTDDFTELWATPIPPIPVDGGEIQGYVEDMQGRFNLNSLVAGDNNQYSSDPVAIERFGRLLEILELEPKWAKIIADWIDTDTQENFPDGAEDSTYTSEVPPYRTANMPITRVSELYAIAGFDREMYLKLEPHVTALPMGTSINLCTASPDVLDALVEGKREFTLARENVADLRKQRCHPTVDVFKQGLSADQQQELIDGKVIDVTSSYFRSTVWVTIGTTQFTLYSLLYRTGTNQVRPILRSFGTT